jgi:hypothetical protein
MNLIQRQEESINRLLAVPPVGRRGSGALQTRMRRAARREYDRAASRMGYRAEQVAQQWRDVQDMAELRRAADDEE